LRVCPLEDTTAVETDVGICFTAPAVGRTNGAVVSSAKEGGDSCCVDVLVCGRVGKQSH